MKLNRLLFVSLVVCGTAALGATSARADVIFSNYSVNTGLTGWIIGSTSAQHLAASFVPGQDFTLTSFEVFGYHTSGTNSFLFSIVADNAGLPTGSSVFSTSGALNGVFGAPASTQFAATGSLLSGSKYWLVASSNASDARGGWQWNALGQMGLMARHSGTSQIWMDDTFSATPTFRINGNPTNAVALTPEMPAGVQAIPVLLAVGGMALYQRKKKAAQG